MTLTERDRKRLAGVHPDLVAVVEGAAEITSVDFVVTEGLRTKERQEQLVRAGASRTLKSRHLTGHAVDLAAKVGDEVRWDWPLYYKLAAAMRDASVALGIPVRWGGTWALLSDIENGITDKILSRSFPDGPHFELPISTYP
jgi:peptidoglycan L-alanyl-D-glutamate endopeptidase CwlK